MLYLPVYMASQLWRTGAFVLFITENDVWKQGLVRYRVNRVIEELKKMESLSYMSMVLIKEAMPWAV